jgi:squalene-associated FAD-dependent desaturase
MAATAHIVGAGLSGLAASVRLATGGRVQVMLYEATAQAGGRCRTYHDPALDMAIDNGNHLVLSGNHAALAYLAAIGAGDRLSGPPGAHFHFVDLASGKRWTLRANDGPLAWWIFSPGRRVPGTRAADYLPLLRLLVAPPGTAIGTLIACRGALYERLVRPLLLAALNTEPREGSAALAGTVLRETLAKGGRAYRPLIAPGGLSTAFVEPALAFLAGKGATVTFGRRLRALGFAADRVASLDFGDRTVALGDGDAVILAVPPPAAAEIVPGLTTPTAFRAIVNAHYRLPPPPGLPAMTGIVNGLAEWLFAFPDRLSVTISGADRLLDVPRETLAADIWRDVQRVAGIAAPMPAWQIVREKRATFAALPEEEARRPRPRTRWRNLLLAGDWTATGLPATIEGAIRSGNRAADILQAGR